MDCKKIKKSAATISSLVIILIFVMGMFFVMFSYLKTQTDDAGIVIEEKYNDTFTRLQESKDDMYSNVNKIQDGVVNITEADSSYQVAVNGFKVLGNTLKLISNFLTSSVYIISAVVIPLDFIPLDVKVLIFLGTTAVIILIVLSVLKGDPKLVN